MDRIRGYEHRQARIAESVIAAVLLAGLAWSWLRPAWTRRTGLAVQGFALLGTLVGAFTIAIGIGAQDSAGHGVPRGIADRAWMGAGRDCEGRDGGRG
jgi:hypothetical protein